MQILFYILSILNGGSGNSSENTPGATIPSPAVYQYYIMHQSQIQNHFDLLQIADFEALFTGGSGADSGTGD